MVVDTNVLTRDLLRRVNLPMNKAIGGIIVDSGVQIGKSLDILQGYPVVHPYLRCLTTRQHPDRWSGKVRQNRVVGR